MRPTLAFVVAVALAPQAVAQTDKEQDLKAFFRNLLQAAQAGDKQAYTHLFTSDAAMFLPHRAPLLGRGQIGEWFDKFRATFSLVTDSYSQEQMDIVGDVAMVRSRGVGHYLVKATGEKVALDQEYLDVLRYTEGAWRMVYHVASSSTLQPGIWERNWERQ